MDYNNILIRELKMKFLKQQNNRLVSPPKYDPNTGIVNCQLDLNWLQQNGYTLYSDQQQIQWYKNHNQIIELDTTNFDNACSYFRQICQQIGTLINEPNFKGGYDDMITFYSNNQYKTDEGMQLAIAWSGCNDLCRYEANKIGLNSPEWWYKCWQDNQ